MCLHRISALQEPSLIVNPKGDIMEGSSAVFSCNVPKKPEVSYTWYFNDQIIAGEDKSELWMFSLNRSSTGNYKCRVATKTKEIFSPHKLFTVNCKSINVKFWYVC